MTRPTTIADLRVELAGARTRLRDFLGACAEASSPPPPVPLLDLDYVLAALEFIARHIDPHELAPSDDAVKPCPACGGRGLVRR